MNLFELVPALGDVMKSSNPKNVQIAAQIMRQLSVNPNIEVRTVPILSS